MATDITHEAGKGPRKHRNVSTSAYREGWDQIFGVKIPPPASDGWLTTCTCSHGGEWCQALPEAGDYICSRLAGHEGEHVACSPGLMMHRLRVWG